MNRDNCIKCDLKFKDGDSRMNQSEGTYCWDCWKESKTPKLKPRFVKIAGYDVPAKMLQQYAEHVDYTRRVAHFGHEEILIQALHDRVTIHKAIFKISGHDHDSTAKEPTRIRKALEEWLEENTLEPKQKDELLF